MHGPTMVSLGCIVTEKLT